MSNWGVPEVLIVGILAAFVLFMFFHGPLARRFGRWCGRWRDEYRRGRAGQ
jgi:hypothetical protein